MLITLDSLIKRYNLDIKGVLHVGAHLAEESDDYIAAGIDSVVWIEGNTELMDELNTSVPPHNIVIEALVGEKQGQVTFHKANNSQSSSILELGTHKTAHPEVKYVSSETRVLETLDILYSRHGLSGLNFMNLDIQGAELSALKGLSPERLNEFDYIYSEVNRQELYVGCCLVGEIDEFLADFQRVETEWTNFGWGDAFYIRRGLNV